MIKKRIVVVDDFTGVRAIIKEALEKKGYMVLEASNGEEAMKFFDGTQIDLLITDYDMPEMDGAKLIAKIRDTSRYLFTPVIMLTGVRKDRIEDKIAHLNIACFLQKPFEIKHFYTVVERLV
jgi:two-component system, chemotaxis family, chemotaxis protein CheY